MENNQKTSSSSSERELKKSSEKVIYYCHQCCFSTNSPSHLKAHTLTHNRAGEFRCQVCNYSAKRDYWLKIHYFFNPSHTSTLLSAAGDANCHRHSNFLAENDVWDCNNNIENVTIKADKLKNRKNEECLPRTSFTSRDIIVYLSGAIVVMFYLGVFLGFIPIQSGSFWQPKINQI